MEWKISRQSRGGISDIGDAIGGAIERNVGKQD